MDPERKKLAKKYEKIKLIVGISESVISMVLLFIFVSTGWSKKLELFVNSYTSSPYVSLLLFVFIVGLISQVLSFPVEYIFDFKQERKLDLSNQSFKKWMLENLKSIVVGTVLVLPLLLLFYFFIRNFEYWWFWLGCIVLIYSVLLAQVAPVLIFPLFYKFKPLENESVRTRILNLCKKIGFKVSGVFSFDMSKNTKKANAAFTGLGKTKRIILSDTLLSGFSEDEIETVFAHELGHFIKGHIKKNILISILTTFFGLFIISLLYKKLVVLFGFTNIQQLAALPLLIIIGGILGVLTRPFGSFISRKFEFEADRFAINTTGNFSAFKSTMEKLAFQNLSDDEPNKFVEFWFHSHPSVKRRIEHAEKYSERINS